MDEQARIFEVEMQPGETIMIKANAKGNIETIDPNAPKKPKRNIAKETEWQKEKYKRFTFTVDRLKAEQFIKALEQQGKTPLDWFKEQIESYNQDTVTVDNQDTVTVNDILVNIQPYVEDNVSTSNNKAKRSPRASQEDIKRWAEQKKSGMSYVQIAKHEGDGRTPNGIRLAVKKYNQIIQEVGEVSNEEASANSNAIIY